MASWPRAAWSSVVPGDQVLAADGRIWDCVERDGMLLTIAHADRKVARWSPAGDVPVRRGEQGRALVAVAGVLIGAGFTVDVIDSVPLTDRR